MIKLKNLLLERTPAEEAKARGLVHVGWGKWKVPGGPVVAKTVNDKLVAVNKQKGSTKTNKLQSNIEAQAAKGDVESKRMLAYIKNAQSRGANVKFVRNSNWPEVAGRQIYDTFKTLKKFESMPVDKNNDLTKRQRAQWSKNLQTTELSWFNRFENKWKSMDATWSRSTKDRDAAFKGINKLTRKYGTPKTGVKTVYRGLKMSDNSASKFLERYKVGDTIDLPPAGYTSDYDVAVGFANFDLDNHSILFNLTNESENVRGIHLKKENETEEQEQELIVPSTHTQKVTNVDVVILINEREHTGSSKYSVVTQISLEQSMNPAK